MALAQIIVLAFMVTPLASKPANLPRAKVDALAGRSNHKCVKRNRFHFRVMNLWEASECGEAIEVVGRGASERRRDAIRVDFTLFSLHFVRDCAGAIPSEPR
jgi:hypothetical protein